MLSVCLKDLIFHGLHGLYPGENKVGGKFIVNVTTSFLPKADPVQNIEETLDYQSIFRLVYFRMQNPVALIETLSMQMAGDIRAAFPNVLQVKVSIEKCNPPIPSFEGSVLVEYVWSHPEFVNG